MNDGLNGKTVEICGDHGVSKYAMNANDKKKDTDIIPVTFAIIFPFADIKKTHNNNDET